MTVNSYAVSLLAFALLGLVWSLRLAWCMWRIGFKSPIDLLNDELARERDRRRR